MPRGMVFCFYDCVTTPWLDGLDMNARSGVQK